MFQFILKKIFGDSNERELKNLIPIVEQVSGYESKIRKLSDNELRAKTDYFRKELESGKILDDILPEAFACVRDASIRTLGMRHFDVQIMGGAVLHQGRIAEMKTGEGKTLVATLPIYLNALLGKGSHVVTVNDYLASRDANWMAPIYNMLGLSVGVIVHGLDDKERKTAYGCDVTYGTNNEFGFDYLRDNMKFRIKDYVQRDFCFSIVDEVDSILIDEARTPLIISGPAEESTDKYYKIDQILPGLKRDIDYIVDEKSRTVVLSEEGIAHVEKSLGVPNLYDPRHVEIVHHVNQALKAHTLFKRDVDYVVKDEGVIIVDEFTGRLMPGRRYSDGLHQALEAKENVKIERENQTLATVTFQNFFRMYDKLAGMTGTAETEAGEFMDIYKLAVVVIPPNKPMIRADHQDVIYKTEKEKFKAVVNEIKELHNAGRPVLVGTISIEKSEHLARILTRIGVKHHVLNAKHHEKEAEIITRAGQPGAVTLSTNMAGRGTDIVLGSGIAEKGGLHILGTERHESRRIDNQLRGRAGRQGDLGSSRFYLSLEDDLLRIFGSDRIAGFMDRLGMEEDTPIEHNFISKAIENAQKRVEGQNFDIRKHLLKYDDVMNQQRKIIYEKRKEVLLGEGIKDSTHDWITEMVDDIIDTFAPAKISSSEWDEKALVDSIFKQFNLHIDLKTIPTDKSLRDHLYDEVMNYYKNKEQEIGEVNVRRLEQIVALQNIDALWKDHLLGMDHLKEGISLRGYAQKDPLLEYQKEGFDMFALMFFRVKERTVEQLFRIQPAKQEEEEEELKRAFARRQREITMGRELKKAKQITREGKKVGRNDPCPCGSGKKYKKCCG